MKKQTYTGNFRSYVDLNKVASENGGNIPDEIQVLPAGEFMTIPYGPMQITPEVFDVMIANFTNDVRAGVAVDTNHDGGEANGWFSELINKGDAGMWAKVDWNSLGKERLADKRYKFFSPEWSFDFVDPLNSTHHGAALIAGSLTNRPLFRTMERLVANETGKSGSDLTNNKTIVILLAEEQNSHQNTMNTNDILAKAKADRSEEEVKFLTDNVASITPEQQTQLDEEAKPEVPETPEVPEKPETPEVPGEGEDKEETVMASELSRLRKIESDHKVAQEQMRHDATEKEIGEKFLIAKEGARITPAMKASVLEFTLKCNDTEKKDFFSILSALTPVKLANEEGDPARAELLTASEKIGNLVKEAMKANDKLTVIQATKQVLANNKELSLQYEQELNSK